jgi:hypothetical protein
MYNIVLRDETTQDKVVRRMSCDSRWVEMLMVFFQALRGMGFVIDIDMEIAVEHTIDEYLDKRRKELFGGNDAEPDTDDAETQQ